MPTVKSNNAYIINLISKLWRFIKSNKKTKKRIIKKKVIKSYIGLGRHLDIFNSKIYRDVTNSYKRKSVVSRDVRNAINPVLRDYVDLIPFKLQPIQVSFD